MWKPSRIIRSAYVLAPAAFLVPVLVSDSGVRAEEAGEAFQLEDIYVVGSRRPVRSVADAPAPIDTIGGVDFTDQGNTNVGDVRIYVSGGKGVLPVVTTTTNRSTPHVPASCDDHEPTPGL